MLHIKKLVARISVVLLVVVSTGMPVRTSDAGSPFAKDIERIRAANQAMEQLAASRLALEQHYLDQVRSLRNAGDASWLELSRQQVAVDSLSKQIESLRKFDGFVQRLDRQIDETSKQTAMQRSSAEVRRPVKVFLPGSIRLIGWIDQESNTNGESKQKEYSNTEILAATADNNQVKLAEERLSRAVKRHQALHENDSSPSQWSRQAELQMNIARAELNFLKTREELNRFQNIDDAQEIDLKLECEKPELVTAIDDENLQMLAYQVAWMEANANGRSKSIETELRRNQLRAKAIERLHADGFATTSELKQARNSLADSKLRLRREEVRLVGLKEVAMSLKPSVSGSSFANKTDFIFEEDLESNLPDQMFSDFARIGHVIDLRRSWFDSEGQRAGTQCKLNMLRKCATRLTTAITQSEQLLSESYLIAGERRQLELLLLEIDSLEAQLQSLDEEMAIVMLEEKRFIAQSIQQDRLTDVSFVGINTGAGDSDSLNSIRRFSYLESRDLNGPYENLTLHCSDYDYLDFTFNRRLGLPIEVRSSRITNSLRPSSLSCYFETERSSTYSTSAIRTGKSVKQSSVSGPIDPLRNYRYGILRPEARRLAPVYQIPWYLPGSPTNVK